MVCIILWERFWWERERGEGERWRDEAAEGLRFAQEGVSVYKREGGPMRERHVERQRGQMD